MAAVISRRRARPLRRGVGRRIGNAPSDVGLDSGGDVEIDNGPRELLHQGPAQVTERIDAGRVPAFERDLQRVLADEGDVADSQLIVVEALHAREATGHPRLAAALRAAARLCTWSDGRLPR